ncbi:hypothetical protein [Phormidium tenue]|jgi:hypothetical protein|uniref:Uncharacterized protein n=1 Tax=Phormidium tenue FACHB-1050 TaxID=2692857 RepID=A0ABR8CIN9_9CYAN|nr:hypothetical protein [Phormidium tenue]MBD2319897.1 hypothetical protein [Phormidium tenue FACHB-1050]
MVIDVKIPEEEFTEAQSDGYVYGVRVVRSSNEGISKSSFNTRYLYVYVKLGKRIEDKSFRAKNGKTKLFTGCTVFYALKDEDLDNQNYCDIQYNLEVRILSCTPWQY